MATTLGLDKSFCWPGVPGGAQSPAIVMDADGEGFAAHVRFEDAGTIERVWVAWKAVAQAPANGIKVSIQGRTTESNRVIPDGVISHYNVIPTSKIVNLSVCRTSTITDDGTATGTKKTVVAGETVSFVFEFNSFQAGDDVDYTYITYVAPYHQASMNTFYTYKTGATWTFTNTIAPSICVEMSDGTIKPFPTSPSVCMHTISYKTLTTASTPDEYGVLFVAPYTGKIGGVRYASSPGNAVNNYYTLYDSNNTVLASTNLVMGDTISGTVVQTWQVLFSSGIDVQAGNSYRFTLRPESSVQTFIYYNTMTTTLSTAICGGSNFIGTQRTDGSSWTSLPLDKPLMGILYTEIGGAGTPQPIQKSGPRSTRTRRLL